MKFYRSNKVVDEALIYDDFTPELLSTIDFDILALGEDHVGGRFAVVEEWCRSNGKEVVRLKRTPGISSSDIKNELTNRS